MSDDDDVIIIDVQESWSRDVVAVFPDICPEYLDKLAKQHDRDTGAIINSIMDQEETGRHYPRRPRDNVLKRKRSNGEATEDDIAKVKRKYDNMERRARSLNLAQIHRMNEMMCADFPFIPAKQIEESLERNGRLLLPTYLSLYETTCTVDRGEHLWRPFLRQNACHATRKYAEVALFLETSVDPIDKEMHEELQAVRSICAAREKERVAKREKEDAENKNYEDAKGEGLVSDCECCFTEFAINRMVHCDGKTLHFFCIGCACRQAETVVGLSKYELCCMSTAGCSAGFSHEERSKFLDDNLAGALDRIEQETVLRIAGLENLAECPFCPFAAEYPPVEEDKEFRCQNPECQIVSCRLCQAKTHIPFSCEEAVKEHGSSLRRKIEEAMSAAMIRKCNKCSTPFIKEHGCNKMMCTRAGCKNVQCYVCSKSCNYTHFNDPTRGGMKGNCPLFDDDVETRHRREVQKAEQKTREQIVKLNPEVDPECLQIKMSKTVSPDQRRRAPVRRVAQVQHNHRRYQAAVAEQQILPEHANAERNRLVLPRIAAMLQGMPVPVPQGPDQGAMIPAQQALAQPAAAQPVAAEPERVNYPVPMIPAPDFGRRLRPRNAVNRSHVGGTAPYIPVQFPAAQPQQLPGIAAMNANAPRPGSLSGDQAQVVRNIIALERARDRYAGRGVGIGRERQQANGNVPVNANGRPQDPEGQDAIADGMQRRLEMAADMCQQYAMNLANGEIQRRAEYATEIAQLRGDLEKVEMANARAQIDSAFPSAVTGQLAQQRPRPIYYQNLNSRPPHLNPRMLNIRPPVLEQPGVRRSMRLAAGSGVQENPNQ